MTTTTDTARYDDVARSLHWATAALIVVAFCMGLAHDVPPRPWRAAWLNVHAITGMMIIVLAVARLLWRTSHPAPPPVAGTNAHAALAVRAGHAALYGAMVVVPVIGFAPLFTRGRGIDLGLFQIASPIARTQDWIKPATEIHEVAAYALVAMAVGHVAAALWHHFGRRDGVLLRMMPARRG